MTTSHSLSVETLGRITVLQSMVTLMPNKVSMLDFVCQGLKDVTGVKSLAYRLFDGTTPPPIDSRSAETMRVFSIKYNAVTYAELNFEIAESEAFDPYIPFLQNFVNMLGVVFEGQTQRKLNETLLEELEQRVAERTSELQEKTEDLRITLNSIGDAVISTDIHGIVTNMNPVAEKLTGWKIVDGIGRHLTEVFQIVNVVTLQPSLNPVERVLATGEIVGLANHTSLIAKDGTRYQIADSAAPIRDIDGSICGVVLVFRDVSEEYRIAEALKSSEEQYREIVERTGDLITSVNENGMLTYVNHCTEKIFGLPAAQCLGKSAFECIHPEDREKTVKWFSDCMSNHLEQSSFENRQINKVTQEIFHLLWMSSFHYDDKGRLLWVNSLAHDITELRLREEERKSHIRFLENLEQVDRVIKQETDVEQMLWNIVKTVFSIFDCDRAWLLYPCDPDAPFFRVPVEITKPEYPGAKVLNVDVPMSPGQALNMQEALNSDTPVTYTDGTERPITTAKMFGVQSQMFMPIYPKLGDPWVFGMHQCSHPRIWTGAEKRLLKEIGRRISDGLSSALYLRELGESETRLKQASASGKVGLWDWNLITNKVFFSSEWKRQIGYEDHEISDDFSEWQCRVHPEDLTQTLQKIRDYRDGHSSQYEVEFRLRHKDDSYRWILAQGSIMLDVQGKQQRFLGSHVDITERKLEEEEKEKLQIQLQQAQKLEAIGQLAGGVAHDFNNMLGVILGHAEMAMEDVELSRPLYANLEEIRKAATRSAEITRQLLAFARKQTVAPKVIDLNETIEGMLKMLRRLIGENIDLAWLPGAGLWSVKIDPSQIDQILANLFVNARDAIAGVGKITVETGNNTFDEEYCDAHAGFVTGEYSRIVVSDNGSGMDKETLRHIFEPFFTTKGVGEGTGLGLATVYGAVRQNDGFINVYSEPGRGTTFTIYLPRYAGQSGQVRDENALNSELHGNETILLVEDEPTILGMTVKMLERFGYTVLASSSPNDAIRQAAEFAGEIQMLMTDVVMPEMNGRDLADRLLGGYPKMKCLFMSGYTANIITNHGVLDEGMYFIQKPFSKKDLAAKVRQVMEGEEGKVS
jgi:PAS domain S-box-containing protein